jgi:1,2-diacylglycerol 3-alpha-glucosyltransferase
MVAKAQSRESANAGDQSAATCQAVVIWIDWYAYHIARFQGLLANRELAGRVSGIELVGGAGVHTGLKFRESIPTSLPVQTLLPGGDWLGAGKWQLARAVWRKLNRLNPAAVFTPGYYTLPALAAAWWAKLHGKKSVLMTESTAHDHSRLWWREALKKMLLRNLFDFAIAGGKPHKRYLQQLGFPSDRVASFYDVVDNSFFADRCREIRNFHQAVDFDLPREYFLFVGRIAVEKNVDGLIAAYMRYREAGGMWSLVLVGDGPQLNEIRAVAANSAYAKDIHFPGLRATSQLPPYYAFASAFVLASTREPWGLVVNEAMAASLPVIVSQRCGCAEDLVCEGQNGFVFDPMQPTDLVEALLRLSKLSLEARNEMGRRSWEIVSDFSPAAWANEVARIVGA